MPAAPVIGTSKQLHRPDKKLISAVLILLIFGLVMLFSASSVAGYLRSGNSLYFLEHQLLGLLFGIPAFIFCSRTDYHFWKKYALQFFVISIGLLLLVFIPGLAASYGKAHNWINIFGLSFQPAEFVKISFLLYLAAWLEVKKDKLGEFSEGLGPFLAVLGIIGFFMLLQPDLGTFAIIAISSLIVYYAASGRMKDILLVLAMAVVGLAVIVGLKSNKSFAKEIRYGEQDT
jgi:cell division protein FtsW